MLLYVRALQTKLSFLVPLCSGRILTLLLRGGWWRNLPGMGDTATWLLGILLAYITWGRRCLAQKLQFCASVCSLTNLKKLKIEVTNPPKTKKPHMNLALHSVCWWNLSLYGSNSSCGGNPHISFQCCPVCEVEIVTLCSGGVGLCSAFLFTLSNSLLCSTLLCLLQAPLREDLEHVFVVSRTKGSAGQCQPQSPAYLSCKESGSTRYFLWQSK